MSDWDLFWRLTSWAAASYIDAFTRAAFVLMIATPFAVWAGRTVYAAARSRRGLYPGHGATTTMLLLPLALIIYGMVRGFDLPHPTTPYAKDEWGQLLFLLMTPCAGMIFGYAAGLATALQDRK